MQPVPPSQADLIAQILHRLEAVEASNKSLTEEVGALKHTVEELKQHSSVANGKPPTRVPPGAGLTSNKDLYLGKNPVPGTTVDATKNGPKPDRVISTAGGTRPKPEDPKKDEPKDDKKDTKKDTKIPSTKTVPPKKEPEPISTSQFYIEHDETTKKDHGKDKPAEPKTQHKPPSEVKTATSPPTPATTKKDGKKPADKAPPATADKSNTTKTAEPKKIMGGSKKDDKKPEPASHEEKSEEVPKESDQQLKLAAEEGEKHVEIEHLEISDATDQAHQAQPAAENKEEHKEEASPTEPSTSAAEEEKKPAIAQSNLAEDVGDLLS